MKPRTVVTVSRKWDNPSIETTVTNDEISLSMHIDDFAEALTQELGPIALILTKGQFKKQLDAAIIRVISGIKQESKKVW